MLSAQSNSHKGDDWSEETMMNTSVEDESEDQDANEDGVVELLIGMTFPNILSFGR
jgi:hypothetical protein